MTIFSIMESSQVLIELKNYINVEFIRSILYYTNGRVYVLSGMLDNWFVTIFTTFCGFWQASLFPQGLQTFDD